MRLAWARRGAEAEGGTDQREDAASLIVVQRRFDAPLATMAGFAVRGRYPASGHTNALTARDRGHDMGMRLRDHKKGDLALTALTLTVAAAAAAREGVSWAARRRRRRRHPAQAMRHTRK